MLSKTLQNELWDVAHALADAAGPIALQYFRTSGQDLENKLTYGFDPVTVADKAIEREMRAILAKRRPDDGVLGEEYENSTGTSGLTWVLDPIDGTRGFISGTPTWGVLIAVDAGEGPVLGLIDQPYTGERFAGGFDVASLTHNGHTRDLAVKSCADISDAIAFTTFPEVGTDAEGAAFERVAGQAKLTRYGMDCYAYALLALGQIDLVIEAGLNAYDIQGPIAVVEAAGGIVTDWQGGPAHAGGQALAASDKRVHEQALKLLNS
ncbi:inositol monophosphatase family protein [Amylibacter sp. SFDW26]|nr:inositol monophosphatase family protein [Amylibacter sp. SFDW26]